MDSEFNDAAASFCSEDISLKVQHSYTLNKLYLNKLNTKSPSFLAFISQPLMRIVKIVFKSCNINLNILSFSSVDEIHLNLETRCFLWWAKKKLIKHNIKIQ